jgi:uncharacterized protein YqeY
MINEKIDTLIAQSMKDGKTQETQVWRAVKTEFMKYRTAKAGNEITDSVEMTIIQKMVAQRKDAYEQYKSAGREDLAACEHFEYTFLEGLLPKEPTEDEIREAISEVLKDIDTPTMKNMKDVMTFVKEKYPTVNGGLVSKLFKEKIG